MNCPTELLHYCSTLPCGSLHKTRTKPRLTRYSSLTFPAVHTKCSTNCPNDTFPIVHTKCSTNCPNGNDNGNELLHCHSSQTSPLRRRLPRNFTPWQLLQALRLQRDETSALRMLEWASKQPHFVPTVSLYETLLCKLAKVGSFASMLQLLDQMRLNLPPSEINIGTFSILVESYASFEFYDEIPGVVDLMEVGFGLKVDREFYEFLFGVLVDGNGNGIGVGLVGVVWKGMVGRGIEPGVSTFRILIEGLCRAGRVKDAVGVMEGMIGWGFEFCPDEAMIGVLMRCCVEEGYLDGFLRIREKLWECGRVREALYVLKSEGMCKARYVRRGDGGVNKHVEEIFDPGIFSRKPLVSREAEGSDPFVLRNRPLAPVVNGNLGERKGIGEATKFGDILGNEGSMHDACEMNSLMHELCVTGNHGVAMELFGEAKSRGCRIDVCTYNILIDSFCSMQRFEDAMSLLREMDSRGCARTVVTYNIMIKGFCKNRFVEEAMVIFQQMELRGVSRNLLTYNTLIDGLCKSTRIKDAVDLMHQMAEEGLKPDKFTFNSMLAHFSRTGNVKRAAEVLQFMTSNGCEPDNVTFNTLIRGMCKASRVELNVAIRIIRTLKVKGMVITPHAYNPVIYELFKRNRGIEAMDFFKEMMEKGNAPNAITYNIVFGWLCGGRWPIGDAIDFAVEMMGKGFIPKSSYFLTLAEGLCALSMEKTLTKLVAMLMEVANLSGSEVSKIEGFLKIYKFRDGLLTLGAILDKRQKPKSAD